MKLIKRTTLFILPLTLALSCADGKKEKSTAPTEETPTQQESVDLLVEKPADVDVPDGMVWVSGVRFTQGAMDGDPYALPREKPAHAVAVDGFFIDKTEVTNGEFKKFVDETGYVTIAERPIEWEEMKKQLPPNTPKPADSVLQPGSLVFRTELENVHGLDDYSQWWKWQRGANWRHPEGPDSDIKGKDNYPVVHVAYEDALAYCKWAGRRLPTEAEWEAAAHGMMHGGIYTWGDDESELVEKANTWQGTFPVENNTEDGYAHVAPVKSFSPNSLGIFDMSGNVWEYTQDWFDVNYYEAAAQQGTLVNPTGSTEPYNPEMPYQQEKVIKGGSFLCNASYCASYRISARMGTTMDSATDHVGFRTVVSPKDM